MKLICPKCGSGFEWEQSVGELEQPEVRDIAAKLGEHWRLVDEYSNCFRRTEFGNVLFKKRLRVFKSIARFFDTLIFKLEGKRYRIKLPDVIKAMTDICNMQKVGFKNNNYLYTMLVKTADRISAEGLSAKEEREKENSKQYGAGNRQGEPGQLNFRKLATDIRR